jgi:hypothetical protein
MNIGNGALKSWFINAVAKNSWVKHRSTLQFPAKSFNEQWKDRKKKGA